MPAYRSRTSTHGRNMAGARGLPYVGIEVRQDLIAGTAGQAQWAERLVRLANDVARELQ